MPLAIGRLVVFALGLLGASLPSAARAQLDTPEDLSLGFAATESTNARPPLIGFRRPQFELQLQQRDSTCLVNGTNFCFGDAKNYCSSCGTCCSSDSSKWCCPSDGVCCGSSCCASGQTCSNGKCYVPVQTVVSTSLVVATTTQVATKRVTIELQVVANSITNSFVVISDTSASTQTNWDYVTVTVTGAGKRAAPTVTPTASRTADDDFTAPTLANELIKDFVIKRRQAEESKNNMDAATSTTVVQTIVTTTSVVSSTVVTTTTVQHTSMTVSTSVQTVTTAINAKTTIGSTSTLTFKLHAPITRTLTEVATIPYAASQSGDGGLSAATNPAALQTGGAKATSKGLSSGATAGIAVGVSLFALAAGLLAFVCIRRRRHNKKTMKTISEDYAYLGTGRSDGVAGAGITTSASPVMQQQHAVRYSGPPPPPMAAALALNKPISRQVTLQSDDHGLPPTPTFARMPTKRSPRSSTSASSPTSATMPEAAFPSQPATVTRTSGSGHRTAAHMRSASAATNLTVGGSTVVGVSARNSVQSTRGMTKAQQAQAHKRAASSGAGSGVTVVNEPAVVGSSSDDSYATAGGSPTMDSPASVPVPGPVPSPPPRAANRPTTADPPSPYFDPRPGPLRIVNTPAAAPAVPSIAEPDELDLGR